jgi:hypothetical protein
MNNLYECMRRHPNTGPVMELLELVEPVDEFSKALCLVRDCFSANQTLRTLSRRQLTALLDERLKLVAAYHTAVLEAAREQGAEPKTFLEGVKALPPGKFAELHKAYAVQVDELMGR